MDTATLDPTTPTQTATIPDQPTQASPVAPPAQAAGATAAPTGADGIQAGYSAPPDPSVAGPDAQPQGPQGFTQTVAGTGAKMLHGILSALGGTQDTTYSVGPDGKLVASQIPSGPGMQFKRIIAGAVAGLAAGAGQTGPGHLGKALAAGTGAGMQQAQQQTAQAKQQAEQDYDQQQKQLLQKAQMAHIGAETVATNLQAAREERESDYVDQDRSDKRLLELKQQGGQVYEPTKSMSDLLRQHQGDPDMMKAFTDGRLIALPQTSDDRKHDGVRFVKLPVGANDAMLDHDMTIPGDLIPAKNPGATGPDGLPTKGPDQKIAAGTTTNGAANLRIAAKELQNQNAVAAASKAQQDRAAADKDEAEAGQKRGENASQERRTGMEVAGRANVARIETAGAAGASGAGGAAARPLSSYSPSIQSDIQGMVDYKVNPGSFPANPRKGSGQISQSEAIGLARQLDPTFDVTQFPARAALRKSIEAGPISNNVRSLNTAIHHLDQLDQKVTQEHNSSFTPYNYLANTAVKMGPNSSQVNNVMQAKTAVDSELAAAFKGTGATDQEIKAWDNSFPANGSEKAQHDWVKTGYDLVGGRMDAIDDTVQKGMGKARDFHLLSPAAEAALHRAGKDDLVAKSRGNAPLPANAAIPPISTLKAGQITTYGNGTSWTLGANGQAQQVQGGK